MIKWIKNLFRKPPKRDEFDHELSRRIFRLEQYLFINRERGRRLEPEYWEMVVKLEIYRELHKLYRNRFKEFQ